MEFYVRKLAKNGVKLVSITQEMGDDPMHVMMRQIMALFDEYQSKENAKHVLRAMNETPGRASNGALPPIGYRIVAAEQRGSKTKKKLEIDPLHADTVRMIYRLLWKATASPAPWASRPSPATSTSGASSFATAGDGPHDPRHPDPHDLYWRAQVQHPLATVIGEEARGEVAIMAAPPDRPRTELSRLVSSQYANPWSHRRASQAGPRCSR
ncbi:MAG: recombinase family protein [Alphaproteobacteria bacterium]